MSQNSIPDPTRAQGMATLAKPAFMLLALVAGAVALREIPAFHGLLADTAFLRRGMDGRLWFCLAGTVWCLFGLPRQVLCFAAGVTYGIVEGTLMASIGTIAGALLCFCWARWGGRAWVRETIARREARLEEGPEGRGTLTRYFGRIAVMLRRHPFETIVTVRLLPVGSSLLLNLFCGISSIAILPFVAATLVGSLPQTFIFVLLGSGAQFGGAARTVVAVLLFILSGVLGYRLLRKFSRE